MLCTKNYINNISGGNFSKCMNFSESDLSAAKQSAMFWFALAMMGVGVVFGNGLVCALFLRYRNLRDATNTFVVSLSFSDILIPLVLLPCYKAKLSTVPYIVAYILFASLFNFCAVTYDRYEAILHPLRYRSRLTRRKVNRILILVWTLPLVVTLIPWSWEHGETQVKNLAGRVYHGILVLSVVSCSFVIFLVYFRIFKATRRQLKLIMKHRNSKWKQGFDKRKLLNRQSSFNCQYALKLPVTLSVEIRAAKVVALLASTFVVCWFPIILVNMYYVLGFEKSLPPALPTISLFSLVGNGLLDPIIYSFLKRDFRKALASLVCRHKSTLSQSCNSKPTYQLETSV